MDNRNTIPERILRAADAIVAYPEAYTGYPLILAKYLRDSWPSIPAAPSPRREDTDHIVDANKMGGTVPEAGPEPSAREELVAAAIAYTLAGLAYIQNSPRADAEIMDAAWNRLVKAVEAAPASVSGLPANRPNPSLNENDLFRPTPEQVKHAVETILRLTSPTQKETP